MGVPVPNNKADSTPLSAKPPASTTTTNTTTTYTTNTMVPQTNSSQPAITPLPAAVAEQMYEEAINLEYAKREGGA